MSAAAFALTAFFKLAISDNNQYSNCYYPLEDEEVVMVHDLSYREGDYIDCD